MKLEIQEVLDRLLDFGGNALFLGNRAYIHFDPQPANRLISILQRNEVIDLDDMEDLTSRHFILISERDTGMPVSYSVHQSRSEAEDELARIWQLNS